jgi:hypothetical protein
MKSGYKEYLDQYKDLVNEPTWADGVGDAFSSAGKGSAKHPEDHQANALLSGVGGGLKGAANEQRRAQLSPMLEQAGQITARAAEIEAQTQIATQSKMQVTQLFQQTAVPIAQLSQASLAGDINASNQLAKGVYARFKQGLGDPSMGDFDHYHNGTIYYENPESGVIEGRNIIGLMYQAGINPLEIWGQDAPKVEAGLSPGAKKNYENTEQMLQLEVQSKSLDNDLKKAHAGVYNTQADKAKQEMNNPVDENAQKLDMEIKRDRATKNYTAIEKEMIPRLEASENVLGVYEAIEDIRKNNPSIVGSDYLTQAKRTFATTFGSDPDIDYANLKSVEFEKMLKPILGAQLGEKEGERVLNKFISLNQNVESIDRFLKEEKPRIIKEIVRYKQKIAHYDKESHANLYSENIHSNVDQEVEDYQKTRIKTVTMIAPDGSTRDVPKDQQAIWEKKGARVVK